MFTELDHIAIAVTDLRAAEALYCGVMGFSTSGTEVVADQGVRLLVAQLGTLRVELMEPLGPDTPVDRFLRKRGEGLHHLCFRVKDLEKALAELSQEGFQLIDTEPRRGAGGHLIAFVHPRSTRGTLIELKEVAG